MVDVMCRTEQCFLCAWSLKDTKAVMGWARTDLRVWGVVALCGTCAGKVKEQGEGLYYRGEEWVTVRVRNGKGKRAKNEEASVM